MTIPANVCVETAWPVLVLAALLILAWHAPKWIANKKKSIRLNPQYPTTYAVYCKARADFRNKIITGTYRISHNGMKEPPNWQEYAEKLELLLINTKK